MLSLALSQNHISVIEVYQLKLTNKLLVQEYFFLLQELNQVIKESSDLLEQLFLLDDPLLYNFQVQELRFSLPDFNLRFQTHIKGRCLLWMKLWERISQDLVMSFKPFYLNFLNQNSFHFEC